LFSFADLMMVLREQFQNLPDMLVTYERTMKDFKKEKIRIMISKTEIRHMIADFTYTANFDFTFRFKYIK